MRVRSKPVIQEFSLEGDPDGIAKFSIRQATFGEDAARETIFANQQYSWNDKNRGETTQKIGWTDSQLAMKEIFLTLCGATGFFVGDAEKELLHFTTLDGIPRLAMDEQEFYAKLGQLEGPIVSEIHRRVREVNIHWQPSKN